MKPLYAILGTLIITTAIAGYYGMCAYIVHTTGTTDGLPHIGEATADIIKALRPVSQVRILSVAQPDQRRCKPAQGSHN